MRGQPSEGRGPLWGQAVHTQGWAGLQMARWRGPEGPGPFPRPSEKAKREGQVGCRTPSPRCMEPARRRAVGYVPATLRRRPRG